MKEIVRKPILIATPDQIEMLTLIAQGNSPQQIELHGLQYFENLNALRRQNNKIDPLDLILLGFTGGQIAASHIADQEELKQIDLSSLSGQSQEFMIHMIRTGSSDIGVIARERYARENPRYSDPRHTLSRLTSTATDAVRSMGAENILHAAVLWYLLQKYPIRQEGTRTQTSELSAVLEPSQPEWPEILEKIKNGKGVAILLAERGRELGPDNQRKLTNVSIIAFGEFVQLIKTLRRFPSAPLVNAALELLTETGSEFERIKSSASLTTVTGGNEQLVMVLMPNMLNEEGYISTLPVQAARTLQDEQRQ